MRMRTLLYLLLLLTPGLLHADVIRMKSGRVFIGKILSITAGQVEIEAFGEKITAPASDITRTERDMSALKDQAVEITLKDKTVIQGRIKNYDGDIGFLIEIDFGEITVPLANVAAIVDKNQESAYVANFTQLGLQGGAYFMVGDLSAAYSPNAAFSFFQEFNLGFIFQGLFTGYSLSYHHLFCTTSSSYSTLLFNVNASFIYRMLFFRKETSFIRNLVPYIGIGAGVAVPVMTYAGTTSAEADFSFTGSLGVDLFINDNFLIRFSGNWLSIVQTTHWFNSISLAVGAACSF